MTTQFISRAPRSPDRSYEATPGPGEYSYDPKNIESNIKKPNFVPFISSARRIMGKSDDGIPPPGTYNVPGVFSSKAPLNPNKGFSTSERFGVDSKGEEPGPGEYILGSTFKDGKRKVFPKSSKNDVLKYTSGPVSVPSIPARSQSYGYEMDTMTNKLVAQKPLVPGFTGTKNDTVGPGDYEPKIDLKYKSAGTVSFGIGDRPGVGSDKADIPGPGYYSVQSEFDKLVVNNSMDSESNLLLRLQAARNRNSASFESKTVRDTLFKDAKKRINQPGPGTYNIPSTIVTKSKPVDKQNFASAEERFKDPVPRSMRLHTAPGLYDPKTSDFDNAKFKVLKQKKITSRSDWAHRISFDSTENRFNEFDKKVVPPPGSYKPKNEFSDLLKKANSRTGAFGSNTKRFEAAKPVYMETDASGAVAEGFSDLMGGMLDHNFRGRVPKSTRPPKYSAVFASKNDRFEKEKEFDGPHPGSYRVQVSWKKGSAVMVPPTGKSKPLDVTPGPGDYILPSTVEIKKGNRKNIFVSTGGRADPVMKHLLDCPGPIYNVSTSLIQKSHNVLLSP